ncbi:hypothetical protein JNUCC1_01153 [Lentibacillus sp. JNUCC-1]|uniref:hypothetical protein n=1 Tax=Lentibacillus sp. JNUCC-1 TaxID=2654513 RepID=UPI0012E83F13|nr:hypothetical protein [Lentibacillus sp. JNUCC-1]MUV37347.1 hypothetical protein [Lentibacillus sp. JNUCC-1]
MPYLFVAAAAVAVLTITGVYKVLIDKLKLKPENAQKLQTQFFIGVAVAEVIPIVLIILGFNQLESVGSVSELYLPGAIVVILMLFAVVFMFLQRAVGVNEESRTAVTLMTMIGIALVMAIPIISIVGLLLLLP